MLRYAIPSTTNSCLGSRMETQRSTTRHGLVLKVIPFEAAAELKSWGGRYQEAKAGSLAHGTSAYRSSLI